MQENKDELYVGSVKLVEINGEMGFNMELVVSKINRAFERHDVQLALKKFQSKQGEETSVMLYATPLPDKDKNKWRTHSLKINTKYRQSESK